VFLSLALWLSFLISSPCTSLSLTRKLVGALSVFLAVFLSHLLSLSTRPPPRSLSLSLPFSLSLSLTLSPPPPFLFRPLSRSLSPEPTRWRRSYVKCEVMCTCHVVYNM
jgi:hypothetical protein